MKKLLALTLSITAVGLLAFEGRSPIAQDTGAQKYSLQVPDGLRFDEFKGYEDWQVISVSQVDDLLKVVVGDRAMIDAYRAGAPANGRAFPDGARMAKIMWKSVQNPDSPTPAQVAGPLQFIDFMVKDSRRFAATAGWGYAQFNYETASGSFQPDGRGTDCGAACHKLVEAKDSVFTAYGRR